MTQPMRIQAKDRFDEPVTPQTLARSAAHERSSPAAAAPERAAAVRFEASRNALMIGFADHVEVALPVQNYPELAGLGQQELASITLGFGGRALCLEARDLHVSIEGLIAASPAFMALAQRLVSVRNGLHRSEAKARASRENGQLGGRPPSVAIRVAPT